MLLELFQFLSIRYSETVAVDPHSARSLEVGDVVNLAARIQGVAEPNGIQVTEAVWVRLQDEYLFGEPVPVKLKGKGTATSYALRGRKSG